MPVRSIQMPPEPEPSEEPRAVALGYDAGHDDAPRVVASGRGLLAEKILETARRHDIPIREDPVLTAALASLDVGELIPPELYRLIAEVYAYIYTIWRSQPQARRYE